MSDGRTQLVGALIADIPSVYSVALIHSAERACNDAGYSLMVCNTDNKEERLEEHQLIEVLDGYSVGGLILNTVDRHTDALAAICSHVLSMVRVDRQINLLDYDRIGLDDASAVSCALDHFSKKGCSRIELIIKPVFGVSSRTVLADAFRSECERRGLAGAIHERPLHADPDTALKDRLSELAVDQQPAAVPCANGVITLGFCRALHGLSAPGPDRRTGHRRCSHGVRWPNRASQRRPSSWSAKSADRLLGRITSEQEPAARRRLPSTLNIRDSTTALT